MEFVVELFAHEDIHCGDCQNNDYREDIKHGVVGGRQFHSVVFDAQGDEQGKEERYDYCRRNFKAKFKLVLFEKGYYDVCYRKHDDGEHEGKHGIELVCHNVAVG